MINQLINQWTFTFANKPVTQTQKSIVMLLLPFNGQPQCIVWTLTQENLWLWNGFFHVLRDIMLENTKNFFVWTWKHWYWEIFSMNRRLGNNAPNRETPDNIRRVDRSELVTWPMRCTVYYTHVMCKHC